MSIIKCAKTCKYQKDGYCGLDTVGKITNTLGGCPYYLAENRFNSTTQRSSGNNFNIEFNG